MEFNPVHIVIYLFIIKLREIQVGRSMGRPLVVLLIEYKSEKLSLFQKLALPSRKEPWAPNPYEKVATLTQLFLLL